MKATISFDLSDPDDREEHAMYLQAPMYSLALSDLDTLFRSWDKHGYLDGSKKFTPESVRENFYKILNDRGVIR